MDELMCSVVIPTMSRPAELFRCLEALSEQDYPRIEKVVVDNAPDAATREIAERFQARYVPEWVPGLSRARNAGAKASLGEIVAFVDDDGVPEPGWVRALAVEFEDPRVGAATGRLRPIEPATDDPMELSERLVPHRPRRLAVDRLSPQWFQIAAFGGLGNGSNMAFRRSVFSSWPGFDPRLGRGTAIGAGEENYAFFSLVKAGYRVVYTPDAVVRHPYPATLLSLLEQQRRSLSCATAYLSFLMIEEKGYRTATMKYLLEALLGRERPWRGERVTTSDFISGPQKILAMLRGPLLYLRSRWARG